MATRRLVITEKARKTVREKWQGEGHVVIRRIGAG